MIINKFKLIVILSETKDLLPESDKKNRINQNRCFILNLFQNLKKIDLHKYNIYTILNIVQLFYD